MRMLRFVLPLVLFVPGAAYGQSAEQIKSDIRAKCVAEWSTDYSMVEYCEKKQLDAAIEWLKNLNKVQGKELFEPVVSDCDSKWSDDYAMKVYCFDKQVKSLNNLGDLLDRNDDNVKAIIGNCMTKWETDYAMIEYCADKQISAYERLNP